MITLSIISYSCRHIILIKLSIFFSILAKRQPATPPPTRETVKCDRCGNVNDVKWYCGDCPAALCYTCKQRHVADSLRNEHKVVDITASMLQNPASGNNKEKLPDQKAKQNTVTIKIPVPPAISVFGLKHGETEGVRLKEIVQPERGSADTPGEKQHDKSTDKLWLDTLYVPVYPFEMCIRCSVCR